MIVRYQTDGVFQNFYAERKKYEASLPEKKTTQTKQNKPLMAGLSLIGAILPVLAINLAKGKGRAVVDVFQKQASGMEKFKSIYNLFEIKNFTDIFASAAGAVTAGIVGGFIGDKNPENKKEKLKEGTFEFLNTMIPTALVATGEFIAEKTGKLKSAPAKALMIAGSVAGGMFIANKASNKINEKTFDKDEEIKEKRNFKISDCFVHIDDILALLVIAKIPFAKVIHADKILPLLYAKTGYEAASAKKPENEKCDTI